MTNYMYVKGNKVVDGAIRGAYKYPLVSEKNGFHVIGKSGSQIYYLFKAGKILTYFWASGDCITKTITINLSTKSAYKTPKNIVRDIAFEIYKRICEDACSSPNTSPITGWKVVNIDADTKKIKMIFKDCDPLTMYIHFDSTRNRWIDGDVLY